MAQDLALFGNFAISELFEELLLPLFASATIHGAEEIYVRAYSTDIDT